VRRLPRKPPTFRLSAPEGGASAIGVETGAASDAAPFDIARLKRASIRAGAQHGASELLRIAVTGRDTPERHQIFAALLGLSRELSGMSEALREAAADQAVALLASFWGEKPNIRFPDIVIAGFGKCGTSSLHEMLIADDRLTAGLVKEPTYFTELSGLPPRVYAAMFPNAPARLLIDSSPSYAVMQDRQLAALAGLCGKACILVAMRDPVERSVSSYYSPGRASMRARAEAGRGPELPTADASLGREMEILDRELPRLAQGEISTDDLLRSLPTKHVIAGLYGLFVRRLRAALPEARLVLLQAERDIYAPDAPERLRARLASEAGLRLSPKARPAANVATSSKTVSPETRRALAAFYDRHMSLAEESDPLRI
jgi:hypothetical protein